MTCYHPITGWRSLSGRDPRTGKWPIVFNPKEGYCDLPVTIPCGQCIGCRLERSRQWAVRCVHEASLYADNCFITLTYSPEYLPANGSLIKRHFQLFMKRLRKRYGSGIRFFHCGEYGELLQRPHYHAILFNFDFPDKKYFTSNNGLPLYISPSLSELWPYGLHSIGGVTFESCAYVARYITKKITGPDSDEYYRGRTPEYITMSRRPGIGAEWFRRFKDDVYPEDYVIIRSGLKARPPRYYDSLYDMIDPDSMDTIRRKRIQAIRDRMSEYTPERLEVKEALQKLRAKKLIRPLEIST